MNKKKQYCTDCDWMKHQFMVREYPRCINPKYKQPKNYSHRETHWDRCPFCSHINMHGTCPEFVQKKMIGTDIVTIFKNLFRGGGR